MIFTNFNVKCKLKTIILIIVTIHKLIIIIQNIRQNRIIIMCKIISTSKLMTSYHEQRVLVEIYLCNYTKKVNFKTLNCHKQDTQKMI